MHKNVHYKIEWFSFEIKSLYRHRSTRHSLNGIKNTVFIYTRISINTQLTNKMKANRERTYTLCISLCIHIHRRHLDICCRNRVATIRRVLQKNS